MTPSSSPPLLENAEPTAKSTLPTERTIQRSNPPGARVAPETAWWRHPLISLGAVLAVIITLTVLARRYVPTVRAAGGGVLRIVARTHLSPRQSVVLIQVGRRMVVAGVTPEHIEALCVLSDPEENAHIHALMTGNSRSEAFSAALTGQRAQFEDLAEGAAENGEIDPTLPAVESLQRSRRQLKDLLEALRTRKAG